MRDSISSFGGTVGSIELDLLNHNMAKNPNGRPTKYKGEKTVLETKDYVDEQVVTGKMPTIAGLAYELGLDKDTINEWSKEHESFSGAIKRLKAFQEDYLIKGGLSGVRNTAMSIFLLKANHGMVETEKRQVEHSGNVNIVFHESLKQDE